MTVASILMASLRCEQACSYLLKGSSTLRILRASFVRANLIQGSMAFIFYFLHSFWIPHMARGFLLRLFRAGPVIWSESGISAIRCRVRRKLNVAKLLLLPRKNSSGKRTLIRSVTTSSPCWLLSYPCVLWSCDDMKNQSFEKSK